MPLRASDEHLIQLRTGKCCFFSRALDFYKIAVFGCDEVEIDGDEFVLLVIQINDRQAIQNTGARCGDQFLHRRCIEFFFPNEFSAGNGEREARAGDRGCARSAIGLQDIAIHPDRAWSEFFQIDYRAQRPANQPLNLDAAAIDAAFCDVPRFAWLRRVPAASNIPQ